MGKWLNTKPGYISALVTSFLYSSLSEVNGDYVKGALNSKNPPVYVPVGKGNYLDDNVTSLDSLIRGYEENSEKFYLQDEKIPKLSNENQGNIQENKRYKEWCKRTFNNGKYIYEAYKDIAFNIKYTPESAKTDFWQTPFETKRSKEGDCEDAVFLFSSHLPSKQRNAMITWGWVIDKESRVANAHVWYQLIDKVGQLYIVEGFSKDWSGIILMEIVEKTETRKPIFSITQSEACRLAEITSKPDSWNKYQKIIDFCRSANFIEAYSKDENISQDIDSQNNLNYAFVGYLLNTQGEPFEDTTFRRKQSSHRISPFVSKEISNILKNLHILNKRSEKQKPDEILWEQQNIIP